MTLKCEVVGKEREERRKGRREGKREGGEVQRME